MPTYLSTCVHTYISRQTDGQTDDRQTDRQDRQTGRTNRQTIHPYMHAYINTYIHLFIGIRSSTDSRSLNNLGILKDFMEKMDNNTESRSCRAFLDCNVWASLARISLAVTLQLDEGYGGTLPRIIPMTI